MKKQKREEMKNVDEELFKKWSRTEYERRQKEDKIKRKQEAQKCAKNTLVTKKMKSLKSSDVINRMP